MRNLTRAQVINQCNNQLRRNETFQKLTGRAAVNFRKTFTDIRLKRNGLEII